ncbi:unnamed protein product [Rotaria sp. Silwood1]|nr:unnamed protein product [Rotaria sp. Silwood1]CAF1630311.1 unnamed protein product [Rotaria sp. Silwood1]CAF3699105.1 unnamed protein product [Rotaria sp. Silwood1]CAF3772450.1 unnamed protein product [Rotaria sp. Silwood1]CAF3804872.1 unnamed protein product [Rotaria sp. Silwood1]
MYGVAALLAAAVDTTAAVGIAAVVYIAAAVYISVTLAVVVFDVSHIIYVRLQSISQEILKKKVGKIEKTHETKLNGVREKKQRRAPQRQILDPVTNLPQEMGDPVTNLSKYNLTDSEHDALVNGLNHVYPPEKLDHQPQFVCNMEYFYARLLNIRTVYRHYEQKPSTEAVRHQLTSVQLSAASELQCFISDQEHKLASPSGSRPARIYGVPKLHKKRENYPLRPVMSATKTVAYGLGKMLANRLNTLRTSPYMIKDRFDFVRKIRKLELGDKKVISGDTFSHFKYLAQIVLAIPAKSTSSEQVFSTTGLIINAKRTMLSPENVAKIQNDS